MEVNQLRQKFGEYFAALGFQSHSPSSLIPDNDPSVLFTTAGMQQFKDFYTEPEQAPNDKLATVQPVIRTKDIAEAGDDTHLTMFEMLGIFNFGKKDSYELKKTAIEAMWHFVNVELGVKKSRVYATVFAGDKQTPEDSESAAIWHELDVKVKKMQREDNFWGPTGETGPCGPNTEIYIDGVEVGNLVFNQYYYNPTQAEELRKLNKNQKDYIELLNIGLDFGAGLERLSATLQGKTSVWEIEPFKGWVAHVDPTKPREGRIIIDHLKAIIFLVSAGIEPANKGRQYVLRRLIRKAVFLVSQLERDFDWSVALHYIGQFYKPTYELKNTEEILTVVAREKEQFERNLNRAKSYLEKWLAAHQERDIKAITELAFYMYESFGFPKELVLEYLQSLGWKVDSEHFATLFERHQNVSRAGLAGHFKGGLADHEPQTIKHHTAHHLLLAALQQVLGKEVVQKGSNVTSERLRIDFNFDRKLTDDELKKVEQIVNEKIQEDLPVARQEMSKDEALKSGAQAEFGQKYGDTVTVYTITNPDGLVFSKELCGGPHVQKTGQLGRFEVLKEEASSQGVRRIKARLV